jgi:signal peptidase I
LDDQTVPPVLAGAPADVGTPAIPARSTPASPYRFVREIVETVLLALVIYLGVRMVVLPYEVEGASMSPNLFNHERLMVNRLAYAHYDSNHFWNLLPWEDREGEHVVYPFGQPERGDIIVFNPPTPSVKPYVKRVIGLPGETITFRNGYVYVDGERLDEEYIDGPITGCERPQHRYCEVTVPEGHIFVLGDNRDNSSDSRYFGVVSIDAIIGEAVFTNWPLDAIGPVPDVDYDES